MGWVEGGHLYLNPPVAYAAVARLLAEQGAEMPKRPATLWGELLAGGWVAASDREGPARATLKSGSSGVPERALALRLRGTCSRADAGRARGGPAVRRVTGPGNGERRETENLSSLEPQRTRSKFLSGLALAGGTGWRASWHRGSKA